MPRTRLKRQPEYPYSTSLDVRVADLNYGGHLGFDRLLGLAHQARVQLFSQLDASELDLGDGKTGVVVSDLVVNYVGEAFLNDRLTFYLAPLEIGKGSFRLAHRVVHQDGKPVALIDIGLVAFDLAQHSPTVLPEPFRRRLSALSENTK